MARSETDFPPVEGTLAQAPPRIERWGRCRYCGEKTMSVNRVCRWHRDLWKAEFEWLRGR
jgi:hypothetical protein